MKLTQRSSSRSRLGCVERHREDLNKVEVQEAELRHRRTELHRYIKETEALPEGLRNAVVDQLVEDELERLETLEWRLARIKKRLHEYFKATEALLDKQEH